MQDFDSEFDKEIRSMLADAEEEVPSHLMDDVFSRLEPKRKAVLPVWLKRTAAVVAAAAAAVAGFMVLSPVNGGHADEEKTVTAEVGHQSEITDNADDTFGAEGLLAEAAVEKKMVHSSASRGAEVLPEEQKVVSEQSSDMTDSGIETDNEVSGGADMSVSGPEDNAGAGKNTVEAEGEDSADEQEAGAADDYFASLPDEDVMAGRRRVSLAVGGDMASNGNAKGFSGFGGSRAPGDVWEDATYLEQTGKNSRYMIPVSFGVSARIPFAKRWSAGVGVDYSMLQRTFAGTYTNIRGGKVTAVSSSDIRSTIHYIGIPVNVYYDIIDGSKVKFYAYAGGAVEKGLANVYRIGRAAGGDIHYRESVKGVQLSAGIGLGVEFALADRLGLYIDPGVRYYFDCGQPVSIRTQQPLMMNFEIGFRVGI